MKFYVDFSCLAYPGLSSIKKSEGPRFIKTHLPLALLPKSAFENGTKVSLLKRQGIY